jgi:hypothetical protein
MALPGLESTNILPVPEIPQGPGVFGPDYSFSDNILRPADVGVRDGSSMRDVTDAVNAAGYYIDMIGFGEPTMSRGLPVKALGVNFWMKTGYKCSNGADMYQYVEGIPKSRGLKGLGPGIAMDASDALNPVPVMEAIFGSGFPECRLEEKEVGDQDGNIQNPETKKYYVDNPESVERRGNKSYQKRWVFNRGLNQDQWEKAHMEKVRDLQGSPVKDSFGKEIFVKTFCPDGFPRKNHRRNDCNDQLISTRMEGFENSEQKTKKFLQKTLLIGCVIGGLLFMKSRFTK